MAVNIKNPEAEALIRQLSKLTGESQTRAITVAARERLSRLESARPANQAQEILRIGADFAARLSPEERALDYDAILYDDRGLFK